MWRYGGSGHMTNMITTSLPRALRCKPKNAILVLGRYKWDKCLIVFDILSLC